MNAMLDYSALLDESDLTAFQNAMSTVLATDFPYLLQQTMCTLGLPTTPNNSDPTFTEVPLTSTSPMQPQPENICYYRMNLGQYMDCCQKYISVTEAASAASVAAWMQSEHNLWFDPTKLTLGSLTADPSGRQDRQLMTVSVDATNYVWVGSVTLYVVAVNHIALLAYPGVAKGLQQSDVMVA